MPFFGARIPPATGFAVDFLEDVGSGKSGNGDEPDLLLDDVTARFQERFQFRNALVEALALPLDLCCDISSRDLARNALKIENKTTPGLVSWRRVASTA